ACRKLRLDDVLERLHAFYVSDLYDLGYVPFQILDGLFLSRHDHGERPFCAVALQRTLTRNATTPLLRGLVVFLLRMSEDETGLLELRDQVTQGHEVLEVHAPCSSTISSSGDVLVHVHLEPEGQGVDDHAVNLIPIVHTFLHVIEKLESIGFDYFTELVLER